MPRSFRSTLALLAAATLLAPTPVPAAGSPWLPANAGVMWWQPNEPVGVPRQPPGEPSGAWWLTRRIAAHPTLPGVLHLGSFFHGLYGSAGGGAWALRSPGCLLPVEPPSALSGARETYRAARAAAVAATGLDACGVESIVYDPVIPTRVYASAYDVTSLQGTSATLGPGGVYVSDDLGATWRRLLGGIRGNGLAVHRALGRPATIVAGYIQVGSSVGSTPGNGSLSISRDDGRTWRHVSLPASGCADSPATSQRITPSVVISPSDPDRIVAGTNAGLYDSNDGGYSWTLRKQLCGGVWGLALSPDGRTVYAGDANGVVWRAPIFSMALDAIEDLGKGKIQSIVADPLSDTLYAAMWDGGDANVFRLSAYGGGAERLDDSLLHDLDRAVPAALPRPFPLTFAMRDGSAPSLFLARSAEGLWVSTLLRGAFVRLER